MADSTPTGDDPSKRRRFVPLAWLGGLLAAALLVLGVNGTLSSWTTAIMTNTDNSAGATATTVALSESSGTETCDTSTAPDNTATCTTIDKFGGNTAMAPGDSETVSVTFTNTGSSDASSFAYAPGTCTSTPGPGAINLCSDDDLSVDITCSSGTTFDAGNVITVLGQNVPPGALGTKSYSDTPALAAGESITCQFTTTLSSDAPAVDAGSSITAPITWTLTA